jgi:serine protease
MRSWRLAWLVVLLCVGCAEHQPDLRLTSVFPSPAKPGDTVTLYGTFPQGTKVVLNEDSVTITPATNSLSVTLPEHTLAGTHTLTVSAGRTVVTTPLQVVPRLDRAIITIGRLVISGAGWPSAPNSSLKVEISGQLMTPEVENNNLIVGDLTSLGYGDLVVRVHVDQASSEVMTIRHAAGTVSGSVVLPAQADSGPPHPPPNVQEAQSHGAQHLLALIAFASPAELEAPLAGLPVRTYYLSALGATHLSFETHSHSGAATALLQAAGIGFEPDQLVATDGSEAIRLNTTQNENLIGNQWFYALMGFPQAWKTSSGEGITVAVLDTGIDESHPDLVANLLPGFDFINHTTQVQDLSGHGTHVAGLVGANGQVTGAAPAAKLLPVRVLEGTGGGSVFTVVQGLLFAANLLPEQPNPYKADIINLSLGTESYSQLLADAVARVQAADVIVVAATGNSGGAVAFPAALPGVIAVTALAGPVTSYQPWYANRGAGTSLTAFGGDLTQDQNRDGVADGILSTDLGGHSLRMGTSMAAPLVSGLIALALAAGVQKSVVIGALHATATDLGISGRDKQFGYGLVSGRVVSTTDPRLYVVAFDTHGHALGWTLVQDDFTFILNNLPPGQPIQLAVMGDADNNLILAEAGDYVTQAIELLLETGDQLQLAPISLTLSDGTSPYLLEARP